MLLYAGSFTGGSLKRSPIGELTTLPGMHEIRARCMLAQVMKRLVQSHFFLVANVLLVLAVCVTAGLADEASAAKALETRGAILSRDETNPEKPVTEVHSGHNLVDGDVKLLLALPQLKHLAIYDSQITSAGLMELKSIKTLEHLDINGKLLSRENLRLIKEIKSLQYLGLIGQNVTDDNLSNLAELDELRGLMVAYASITAEGYKHITRIKDLRELWVFTPNSVASFREINKLKNLRKFAARGHEITDSCISELKDLTKLELIALETTEVTGKGMGRFKKLKELLLTSTHLSDEGLKELGQLKELRILDASNTKVTAAGLNQLRKQLPECKIEGPR